MYSHILNHSEYRGTHNPQACTVFTSVGEKSEGNIQAEDTAISSHQQAMQQVQQSSVRTVNINPEINPQPPFQAEAHTEDKPQEIDLKFEAIEMKGRENTDTSRKDEPSQNLEKSCIIFSAYQGLASFSTKGEEKKYFSSVERSASVTYLCLLCLLTQYFRLHIDENDS